MIYQVGGVVILHNCLGYFVGVERFMECSIFLNDMLGCFDCCLCSAIGLRVAN